ncbi:MAG: carbon storage regulator [Deltaproteobacteria bacterium]|nr:carbon storage regulator [Deltaproteobacteria bacterium]
MLVISRRKGQSVTIGDDIEVTVTQLHKGGVKLGIRAPRGLTVLRGEIREAILAANRTAASAPLSLPVTELAGAVPGAASGLLVPRRQPADARGRQPGDAPAGTGADDEARPGGEP